MKALIEV